MKKITGAILLTILMLSVFVFPAAAQSETPNNTRDSAFEKDVYDRLEKVSPQAVPIFIAATEALDRQDLEAARLGFEQVLALAPDFSDALRRLSYVHLYLDHIEQAEALGRRALEVRDAPENKSNLALILLSINSPASNLEAFHLAQDAYAEDPSDLFSLKILMIASSVTERIEVLRQSCAEVIRRAPEDPTGYFYRALAATTDENWMQAEADLLLARKLGFPAEIVQGALDSGITTQARIQRGIRLGIFIFLGWIVTLGLLFLVGVTLSRATLASVNRQKTRAALDITPGERLTRRIYRVIIAIASAYFYLSIPILLFIVLALMAVAFYAFLSIGQIPIKLALLILIAGIYTLIAVVRSLFIRRPKGDPGQSLAKTDALYLWELLDEVARKVGTRPVEKVFITPGPGIGVYERGNWWKRLRGRGERCLILGLGALPGMNQGQFRAILAHEYGHFCHADTAGGDLAHTVGFNIQNIAQGLANVGTAVWYNPVWLFINGYYRVFLRITRGASRLQEILADRYAATQYGAQNMAGGLEYVIRQELRFQRQSRQEINQAVAEKRKLQNLYTLPALEENPELETEFEKIMQEKTSPYASHPSPSERLDYIRLVPEGRYSQDDPRPVWDLFADATGLQADITRSVEDTLRAQGALPPA